MEGVISDSFCVYDESALRNIPSFLLWVLLVVVVKRIGRMREDRFRFTYYLHRLQLSILADRNKPPIVKSTLPELAEVNTDFILNIILTHDVPWLNLVPRQEMVVVVFDW